MRKKKISKRWERRKEKDEQRTKQGWKNRSKEERGREQEKDEERIKGRWRKGTEEKGKR